MANYKLDYYTNKYPSLEEDTEKVYKITVKRTIGIGDGHDFDAWRNILKEMNDFCEGMDVKIYNHIFNFKNQDDMALFVLRFS